MRLNMSWIRICLINLIVLLGFLAFLEIIIRTLDVAKTCIDGECDFIKMNIFADDKSFGSKHIGISRFDKITGYALQENFYTADAWKEKIIKINDEGFRVNRVVVPRTIDSVLAVGDSFTFGDQVSNQETWTSCLQDYLGIRVDNAGVFGYGVGQSILRAQYFQELFDYDTIILSILVGSDFERDRLNYRDGFPKPYLTSIDNNISWSEVSDPSVVGLKSNPNYDFIFYISKYSRLYRFLSSRVSILPLDDSSSMTSIGKNAAKVKNIIPWLIKEFSNIQISNKVVLLQYSSNALSSYVNWERKIVKDHLKNYKSITLVDTADKLSKYEPLEIWDGHHTALGNVVVCDELYSVAFK
jgi:hypothetical protein